MPHFTTIPFPLRINGLAGVIASIRRVQCNSTVSDGVGLGVKTYCGILQAGHFEPAADIIVNWGYFTAGKQGILLLFYKYPAFPVLCAGEAIGGVAVLQNGLISK